MGRILERLIAAHGDDYLIREAGDPIAEGARNWTQIIQRLVDRAKKSRTPDQVRRRLLESTDQGNVNWYSIRRTFADWLDERVSDAAISAVMGHFEISARTRRQLFENGAPQPISTSVGSWVPCLKSLLLSTENGGLPSSHIRR
jgi:hypothetical protein